MEENIENKNEQGYNLKQEEKQNKFWTFIKKHKMSSFLFVLLFISIVWSTIKVNLLKTNHSKELKLAKEINVKQVSKVFSWVVNNDKLLIEAKNTEQINIYFSDFVKEEGLKKIMLLEYPGNKVILSTDSKDIGNVIKNLSGKTVEIIKETKIIKSINPIIIKGLNEQVATLVIEYEY